MGPLVLLRMLAREVRGAPGRFLFMGGCIVLGVTAVVAVSSFVDAVELGIRGQSRALLGGDLALSSRRPLPDAGAYLPRPYRKRPIPRVDMAILSTMLRSEGGASRLVEVKAIETQNGSYPLAGQLELTPPKPLSALLDDASVLLAPELLRELGLSLGDTVHVGGVRLRVTGIVQREPDPISFRLSFGPRVLMSLGALRKTGLLGFGSRIRYRTVFAFQSPLPDAELARMKSHLAQRFPGGGAHVRIETQEDAQPAIRLTLERAGHYFGLVALLSLLVGSVGVAQIVSGWLKQAAPQTAILRCLGVRPREVLLLYLGLVLLLSLASSLVGASIGAVLPAVFAWLNPDLVPLAPVFRIPYGPMIEGTLLGVGVALLFSLPALGSVWRVPPARVLRSEVEGLPVPLSIRAVSLLFAVGATVEAAWLQSGRLDVALAFSAGLMALSGLLWLGARGLARAVGRLPRARLSALAWQAMAALGRPGAVTTGGIVALGLGSLVVLAVVLLQQVLGDELDQALPADAPNVFLLDIQPDQWLGVKQLAQGEGASGLSQAPIITARLTHIDDRSVKELVAQRPERPSDGQRRDWVLTREQRITIMRELPPDNEVVEGQLWSEPGLSEVSLEAGFARDLGARVGTKLRFDVQGVPMDFTVTSLRKVQWRSFSMNFFFVAEPGPLDDAPQILLAGVKLSEDREQRLQNLLAKRYPNVTVLRVRSLLERADELVAQVALAVRTLCAFAALSGLIILAGGIAAGQLRRARETALLKALGITRPRIMAMFALEYALSGLVAGVLGAVGAYFLVRYLSQELLELAALPSWRLCVASALLTSLLAVGVGLLASLRALQVPPLEVLRESV